jgi:hypothetical protein
MAMRLGDLLVRQGVLTEAQRDDILRFQETHQRPFGELAETLFGVEPGAVEQAWATQYAMLAGSIDPREVEVSTEALEVVNRRQAWQFKILPIARRGHEVQICTTQEHLARALRFVGWRVCTPCHFVLADAEHLGAALMKHYPITGFTAELVHARGLGRAEME